MRVKIDYYSEKHLKAEFSEETMSKPVTMEIDGVDSVEYTESWLVVYSSDDTNKYTNAIPAERVIRVNGTRRD